MRSALAIPILASHPSSPYTSQSCYGEDSICAMIAFAHSSPSGANDERDNTIPDL